MIPCVQMMWQSQSNSRTNKNSREIVYFDQSQLILSYDIIDEFDDLHSSNKSDERGNLYFDPTIINRRVRNFLRTFCKYWTKHQRRLYNSSNDWYQLEQRNISTFMKIERISKRFKSFTIQNHNIESYTKNLEIKIKKTIELC